MQNVKTKGELKMNTCLNPYYTPGRNVGNYCSANNCSVCEYFDHELDALLSTAKSEGEAYDIYEKHKEKTT